jgi:hypothetical protein
LNERQDRIKDRLNNLQLLFEEEAKHQREVQSKYATAEQNESKDFKLTLQSLNKFEGSDLKPNQ